MTLRVSRNAGLWLIAIGLFVLAAAVAREGALLVRGQRATGVVEEMRGLGRGGVELSVRVNDIAGAPVLVDVISRASYGHRVGESLVVLHAGPEEIAMTDPHEMARVAIVAKLALGVALIAGGFVVRRYEPRARRA